MKKNKTIAIQGDPINLINKNTDTTLLIALEAQRRKYKIYYYETKDITFINNKVLAYSKEVFFNENKKNFYHIKRKKNIDLKKVDFIFMRQNPPFNMNYITATFLLDKISKHTTIINDPTAVRNLPEKIYSTKFLKHMPPTIFTQNLNEIEKFLKKYKKVVLKPTHGYGGKNVFLINKKTKRKEILKYLKKNKDVMVQKFLYRVRYGDKRVFIINGRIKGAILRVPKKGSILSNIAQGGTAMKTSSQMLEYH